MDDLAWKAEPLTKKQHIDRLKEVVDRWLAERDNALRGRNDGESLRHSWGGAVTSEHDLAVEASLLSALRVVVNQAYYADRPADTDVSGTPA